MAIEKKIIKIGLSGIALPGAKKTFPVEYQNKSRLFYYATLFNTIEINSTFYKVPMLPTIQKWTFEVPKEFQFTIKLWREITHAKELNFHPEHIDYFMKVINSAGNKKGCLLIQFPASITIKYFSKVEKILDRLQRLDPENEWRKALEFRHTSWYNNETYSLLDKYHASIVLHDMPNSGNDKLNESADFAYLRFHGIKGDYKGSYPDEYLSAQAEKIKNWAAQGKNVYAYFNNTMGDAFLNAQTLIKFIN